MAEHESPVCKALSDDVHPFLIPTPRWEAETPYAVAVTTLTPGLGTTGAPTP